MSWRSSIVSVAAAIGVLTGPSAAQQPATPTPAADVPVVAAASADARSVLAGARPSVIQIEGFFGSNTAQAFHGTGFAVAPGGVFMTNYHVVAEHVQLPDKYRLEYRTTEGQTGKLKVLSVDVRNDLAVVQADGYAPAPLMLDPVEPPKGTRAYSVGFPLDVGLTITEGVSNGKVEDSFSSRIHYSGALNGGMSGGPALNSAGAVIGINVSGYLFQQLVSFIVPAVHAKALLDRAPQPAPDIASLKADIVVQARAHSKDLLGAFDGKIETQSVAGYTLPSKLAPFVECNATGDPLPNQPVETVRINCSAKAGLHLQQGLTSGNVTFTHIVLTTTKLDAWRFAYRMSAFTTARGQYGSRQHVGPFACKDETVALNGFDARLLVCTRAYRKLEGLYDMTVRLSSLNGEQAGFTTHLDVYGLEHEAGMRFIKRFVEAMAWKP